MQPELHLLGHDVRTFGLTVVAAYVAALLVLARRAREIGVPPAWAGESALLCTLAGLLGARLLYVAEHAGDPGRTTDALLAGGGLTWYGGLIAGAGAALAYIRVRGVPLLLGLDVGVVIAALAQAIGRVGCQLSGDGDYGVASGLPWAMGYPHGTVPTAPGVEVHPTPVYESVALGLIAMWLWRRRDTSPPGTLFGLYLVLAGSERFLVELIRRNRDVLAFLSLSQLVSIGLVVAGAVWLLVATDRQTSVQMGRRAVPGRL